MWTTGFCFFLKHVDEQDTQTSVDSGEKENHAVGEETGLTDSQKRKNGPVVENKSAASKTINTEITLYRVDLK